MANPEDRLCVLVADDDAARRDAMIAALSPDEYLVHHAPNGAVALEKALLIRPDVVVTAYEMPVVGGAELIESLGLLVRPRPAIVAISRFVRAAVWCNDHGVEVFLARPFTLASFVRAVAHLGSRVFESHRPSRSGLRSVMHSACVLAVGNAVGDLRSTLPAAIRHARLVVIDSLGEAMQILRDITPELVVVSADPQYEYLRRYAASRGIPCLVREDARARLRRSHAIR